MQNRASQCAIFFSSEVMSPLISLKFVDASGSLPAAFTLPSKGDDRPFEERYGRLFEQGQQGFIFTIYMCSGVRIRITSNLQACMSDTKYQVKGLKFAVGFELALQLNYWSVIHNIVFIWWPRVVSCLLHFLLENLLFFHNLYSLVCLQIAWSVPGMVGRLEGPPQSNHIKCFFSIAINACKLGPCCLLRLGCSHRGLQGWERWPVPRLWPGFCLSFALRGLE